MTWWGYVLIGVAIFASGFAIGRSSKHESAATVGAVLPDAGVAVATATVTGAPVSCDAGVVVVVKPGKPYIVYLPADAGTIECPACPEVQVTATSGSLAGPTTAQATATAPPPVVITRVEFRDTHKLFGVGPAFTKTYDLKGVGYGATVQWQPLSWLELSGIFTTKEVMLSPTVRF